MAKVRRRTKIVKTRRRRRSTRHVAKSAAVVTHRAGKTVMLLPKRLKSLNARRGGHWEEHSERLAWEQLIAKASIETDGSVSLPVTERRRLAIVRLAPSRRYLLDKTNLDASGKRLEDALVALGYLVTDDRFGVDGPFITQALSSDNCYWTVVILAPAAPYIDDVVKWDAALLAALSLAS